MPSSIQRRGKQYQEGLKRTNKPQAPLVCENIDAADLKLYENEGILTFYDESERFIVQECNK